VQMNSVVEGETLDRIHVAREYCHHTPLDKDRRESLEPTPCEPSDPSLPG
jgi:hypothetical protein